MIADSSKPNKLRNVYTIRSTTRSVTIQKRKINYIKIKTLYGEALSEPEFYGDLVYKFKKLIGTKDFSIQFRKKIHVTDV